MAKLRPAQRAKKITCEVLRENPLLRMLARMRAKELREVREEKKKWELDLD